MPHIIVYAERSVLAEKVHLIGSDAEVFRAMGGAQADNIGKNYKLRKQPLDVLDGLKRFGYKVVGFAAYNDSGIPAQFYWTLDKDDFVGRGGFPSSHPEI